MLKERLRNLQQHAGPVAGQRIASARPAMGEVVEHLQSLDHDLVRALALYIDDKPHTAGVVFVFGVVQTLCFGECAKDLHRHALLVSALRFFALAWRWRLPLPASCGDSSGVTQIWVRSVWVERTTMVSVRVTPSIMRMVRIRLSSVAVLCVFTLSKTVCSP